MTLAETKKAKKHIVVFQDEEGNVLKTSFVSHEEAALPPEMPEKRGDEWVGVVFFFQCGKWGKEWEGVEVFQIKCFWVNGRG